MAAILWTGLMLASLKWHFLDRFSAGTPDRRVGVDFFQVPRGYENLFHGNSILLTELSQFGPYGTPYVLHPCLAIAVGSWTSWLGPWAGYCAFVAVSLGLLLLSARLLALGLAGSAWKGFAFFAMICSVPVYYLLWAGQMHVFLVAAVALILAGLMRLEREDLAPNRHLRWIQAGILLSLFSKPAVVLMLPVLLVTRETRKCVLGPVAIYAVVSLLFLALPVLNPGGYNGNHWTNMVVVSLTPKLTYCLAFPLERDLTKLSEIYSLPVFVHRLLGHPFPSTIRTLLTLVILGLSATPLLQTEKSSRLRAAVVTVCLCVLMHYLAYHAICEYQYTTILPLLPAHVWLWQRESVRGLRRLLAASFAVSLLIFWPTLNFLDPADPSRYWLVNSLVRVVPVVVDFLGLALYGTVLAWLAIRRSGVDLRQVVGQVWPILGLGGAAGALLCLVLLVVYETTPTRLWSPPSSWTGADWRAHFEDMVGRDGVSVEDRGQAYLMLARSYAPLKPDTALARYASAIKADRDVQLVAELEMGDLLDRCGRGGEARKFYGDIAKAAGSAKAHYNFGAALMDRGRTDEAMVHFRKALEIKPKFADAHYKLGVALVGRGRPEEAIAHYQEALNLKPDYAEAHINLGIALAGRGRMDEAMTHFQQALEVEPGYAAAHVNVGVALAGCGRMEEAMAHFQKALEIDPDSAAAHLNLGTAWAQRGGVHEAIDHFQQALEIKPDYAEAHKNLGIALAEYGRIDEAIDHYQKALALATQQDNTALAEELRARLGTYQAGTSQLRQPR
jgi:tetratricopeptide (TPR) repeat protein